MDIESSYSSLDLCKYSGLKQISLALTNSGYLDKFQSLLSEFYSQEFKTKPAMDPQYKQHLKTVLSDLVDQVWNQSTPYYTSHKRTASTAYTESLTVPETSPSSPENTNSFFRKTEYRTIHSQIASRHRRVKTAQDFAGGRLEIPSRDGMNTFGRQNIYSQSSSRATSPQSTKRTSLRMSHNSSSNSLFQETQAKFSRFSEFSHIRSPGTFSKSLRILQGEKISTPGPAAYRCDRLSLSRRFPTAVIPKGGNRHSYIQDTRSPGPSRYHPMKYYASRY